MKETKKIVMLVALALALMLTLSACKIAASQPPAATPTAEGGVIPFPVNTLDPVSAASTSTALASTPLPVLPTETPTILEATPTTDQAQPAAAATTDPNAGGGVVSVVNTPVVERPTSYILKKGEWPICIARRYDLDIDNFFSANSLSMDSKPAAGVKLNIPTTGTWDNKFGARSLKSHPVDYTVVAGDSLYSIACKFGDVTPEAILAVNGLASDADIKVGLKIKIP